MCPLFGGSTVYVHKEEDNLSIVDERASPNVSFIRRFHTLCILVIIMEFETLLVKNNLHPPSFSMNFYSKTRSRQGEEELGGPSLHPDIGCCRAGER